MKFFGSVALSAYLLRGTAEAWAPSGGNVYTIRNLSFLLYVVSRIILQDLEVCNYKKNVEGMIASHTDENFDNF